LLVNASAQTEVRLTQLLHQASYAGRDIEVQQRMLQL